jgi:hypothetical protein
MQYFCSDIAVILQSFSKWATLNPFTPVWEVSDTNSSSVLAYVHLNAQLQLCVCEQTDFRFHSTAQNFVPT